MKFLKSFPFLSAAFVQAALAFLLAAGVHLSPAVTGSIEAAAAAVLALLVAPHVSPVPVPLILGALTAIGALLVALKIPHITAGEVSAVVAALAALLGAQGHQAVTNKHLAADRAVNREARSRPAGGF